MPRASAKVTMIIRTVSRDESPTPSMPHESNVRNGPALSSRDPENDLCAHGTDRAREKVRGGKKEKESASDEKSAGAG